MTIHFKENQALENYDITDYKGSHGKNFYQVDSALKRMVWRYGKNLPKDHYIAMENHLLGFGEIAGSVLNELTEACHKEGKYGEVQKYDRTGNRVDNIVYSKEQLESRKIHYDYGIVNLDFHKEWGYDFPHIHRYALAYLANLNGEAGVTCPLAMTDGMILALKKIGSDEQKKKYLPLVAGQGSHSHFMCGQYVTERVGGSNVAANRTIAKKREDGKWILTGEKWFCSNPGDLWVTTAKIEGTNTIGMFLVPRFKDDGSLNNHHILRKKDIIGSRGKVTAEVVYDGVEAEEFGRPGHGLANMIRYVIKTSRIHVGLGACGNARRAVMEALEYARFRTAYGKSISEFPAYYRILVEMMTLQTANIFMNFRMVEAADKNETLQDALIPLMKYKSSSQAAEICRMAILCLGGNGIIGDFSPVPRMLNDSIINESWEGTHLIITDHFLHAISKKKVYDSWVQELEKNIAGIDNIKSLVFAKNLFHNRMEEWKSLLERDKSWKEMNRVYIADRSYELFTISLLIFEAVEEYKEIASGSGNGKYSDSKNDYNVYEHFVDAYSEILEKGIQGPRDIDRTILDPIKSKRILAY